MTVSRAFQQSLLWLYLVFTGAALFYTLTRIVPPVPTLLLNWSYGMMAPYQGDTDYNDDFVADGKLPGEPWERIDLREYIPTGFGEFNVRLYLRTFESRGIEAHRDAYKSLAKQLLEHERTKGKNYEQIRITHVRWPRSPDGFYALINQPILVEPIVTVP